MANTNNSRDEHGEHMQHPPLVDRTVASPTTASESSLSAPPSDMGSPIVSTGPGYTAASSGATDSRGEHLLSTAEGPLPFPTSMPETSLSAPPSEFGSSVAHTGTASETVASSRETTPFPAPANLDAADDSAELNRIRTCIDYTHAHYRNHPNTPLPVPTFFTYNTVPLSPALQLLRGAHASHIARLIRSSATSETYELGAPPQSQPQHYIPETRVDPHWWVGKSKGQIRAGPHASAEELKEGETTEKKVAARKKRDGVTKAMKRELSKLEEGVRRQEAGEQMWDEEAEK